MRIFSATIIMAVILVSSAFCQVDTLMLVEINSIEIVDDITELYVEDLDGDEIKEIILCTQFYIYIYNSQTNELIWTSPLLTNPDDLLFEDINHDGLLDISVNDSLNIWLFDPHNYNTIWISPALDSTYKCYTIGDRNDDEWVDVAIVSKEPFARPDDENNLDTVWIDLFDGPQFNFQNEIIILMRNYICGNDQDWVSFYEFPFKIMFRKISNIMELKNVIIINSKIDEYWDGHGGWYEITKSGNIWVIDSDSFEYFIFNNSGSLLYEDLSTNNGVIYFQSLNYFDQEFNEHDTKWLSLNTLSADTIIMSDTLWGYDLIYQGSNLNGQIIGELNYNHVGKELCFGAEDSLYLLSFPENETIWIASGITNSNDLFYVYNSNELYNSPQIMYGSNDEPILVLLFNGADGCLSSFILNQGFDINKISDLNSDSNDELLSIQGNELHIYHLDYYVDVDQPETLPCHTFIQPNYPNPFNNSTTIEYGLKQDERVVIEIYDLLGRKIETLVDVYQPAGMHRAIWNADQISTGIYFYKINAGDFSKTRKMLLLK